MSTIYISSNIIWYLEISYNDQCCRSLCKKSDNANSCSTVSFITKITAYCGSTHLVHLICAKNSSTLNSSWYFNGEDDNNKLYYIKCKVSCLYCYKKYNITNRHMYIKCVHSVKRAGVITVILRVLIGTRNSTQHLAALVL